MNSRVSTLSDDVSKMLQAGGVVTRVRVAAESEVEKFSDLWHCTHAVFLDDHIALGVVEDSSNKELLWYVYTFMEGEWGSHNDTGEGRSFAEALSDAVSVLFYLRTYQLPHGIQE